MTRKLSKPTASSKLTYAVSRGLGLYVVALGASLTMGELFPDESWVQMNRKNGLGPVGCDLLACSRTHHPLTPSSTGERELLYPPSGVHDGYWGFEGPFGSTRGT